MCLSSHLPRQPWSARLLVCTRNGVQHCQWYYFQTQTKDYDHPQLELQLDVSGGAVRSKLCTSHINRLYSRPAHWIIVMLTMLAEQYMDEGHHSQDCTTLRYASSQQLPLSVNRLSRISALSRSAASERRPTSTSAQVDQPHNAPLVFLASQ